MIQALVDQMVIVMLFRRIAAGTLLIWSSLLVPTAYAEDLTPTREETCFAVFGFASMGLMIDGKTMRGFELLELQTNLEPKTRQRVRKLVRDGLVQEMEAGRLTKARLFEMVGYCEKWYPG